VSTDPPRVWSSARVHGSRLPGAGTVNAALAAAFEALGPEDFSRRTHHVGGRWENLYLDDRDRLPGVGLILAHAEACAREILAVRGALRCGFWLNAQDPGQSTSEHNHDENDELLSGVYYVRVPPESGDLVLLDGALTTRVSPAEGMFLFFPPPLVHRVEANRSRSRRLSLAFNFGPGG
jgi:hypothetical protein